MSKSFMSMIFTNFLLILGVVSLLMALDGYFYYAGLVILLSGVYYHFEAEFFKLLNINPKEINKIGYVHSSSLLLTFAVMPMVLVYLQFNVDNWGFFGGLMCLLFPLAAQEQLKRIHVKRSKTKQFLLPLPLAGVTLTFFGLILQGSPHLKFIIYIIMLGFSYLMIRPNP